MSYIIPKIKSYADAEAVLRGKRHLPASTAQRWHLRFPVGDWALAKDERNRPVVMQTRARETLKVANNTYLERIDGSTIGIRLHSTYVVVYAKCGRITLTTGGWHTKTTVERINAFAPCRLGSARSLTGWRIAPADRWPTRHDPLFRDGTAIDAEGNVLAADAPNVPYQTVSGWA